MVEFADLHPLIKDKGPLDIFSMILDASVIWNIPENKTSASNTTQQLVECTFENSTSLSVVPVLKKNMNETESVPGDTTTHSQYDVHIIGEIAHIFHYCSIAILAVIMVEVSKINFQISALKYNQFSEEHFKDVTTVSKGLLSLPNQLLPGEMYHFLKPFPEIWDLGSKVHVHSQDS